MTLDLMEPAKTLIVKTLEWNSKLGSRLLDPLRSIKDAAPLPFGL